MLIKEYMTPDPIVVDENISIIEAAEKMKKNNVRRFPVLRDGKLVGIITDRDLRSAGPSQVVSFDESERKLMPELHSMLANITVDIVMARDVITVALEQSIVMAASLMLKHRISGMPVVDPSGKIVGIITEGDIFKALVDFSGISQGPTLIALDLEDRPGSIKEVSDIIREQGARVSSILTSAALSADPKYRRVCIRISDLPQEKREELKKILETKFILRYMIQDGVDDGG